MTTFRLYDIATSRRTKPTVATPTVGAPVSFFIADTTTAPPLVTFTNYSTGIWFSNTWDFGDGDGTASRNATHTYVVIGGTQSFTVTLTLDAAAVDTCDETDKTADTTAITCDSGTRAISSQQLISVTDPTFAGLGINSLDEMTLTILNTLTIANFNTLPIDT